MSNERLRVQEACTFDKRPKTNLFARVRLGTRGICRVARLLGSSKLTAVRFETEKVDSVGRRR